MDQAGALHFNGSLTNKGDLATALENLDSSLYGDLVIQESNWLQDIFEHMFQHESFTGRSGTFFGYEGLGCIYWHMVSKLMVAVAEICNNPSTQKNPILSKQIRDIYYDIRKGLGLNKTPAEYMAFPADPYSHTPGHRGAQQPGMTGQVKEDIITRFAELGLLVRHGEIHFTGNLLRSDEFLTESESFLYTDVRQVDKEIKLESGLMAYTYCQVPVIYRLGDEQQIAYVFNGNTIKSNTLKLNALVSKKIFERTGEIKCIEVTFTKASIID